MENFIAARQRSKIDVKELALIIYDTPENYNRLIEYTERLKKDPGAWVMPMDVREMSREEIFRWNIESNVKFRKLFPEIQMYDDNPVFMINIAAKIGAIGIAMVIPALEMMATQEQRDLWLEKLKTGEYSGAYAQTEMAHGSDVQSLKTTATYNKENDTFILNTPSTDAYKWWPGDLGVYATHALVYAQIIVNGSKKGAYPLFVQIRDIQTYRAMENVEIGDMGPKIG